MTDAKPCIILRNMNIAGDDTKGRRNCGSTVHINAMMKVILAPSFLYMNPEHSMAATIAADFTVSLVSRKLSASPVV